MNLLITGAWQGAKENIEKLEQMGHVISFLQYEKDELPCEYEWVEGVIGNGIFLHHPIEKFENLRYIQLTSAGYDRVPMDYVSKQGIEIHNAGGVYSIPMAEWVVMRILEIYKNAEHFYEAASQHQWNKNRNMLELYGKTACIVGTGSVGQEIAKRLNGFGVTVIGLNRSGRTAEYFDICKKNIEWEEAVKKADIVILALPLTKETENMVNKSWFSVMKKDSILVNVARGQIVDEKALEEAIQDGQIMAAALDVFAEEPLVEEHPFWKYSNILISPHNSFVGENNQIRLAEIILRNIKGYL